MADLLLGIDVGSNSTKAVLCRPDGTVVVQGIAEHEVDVPRPGWAEMDADKVWWGDLVSLSHQVLAKVGRGDRLAGVAVSAMGPCVLPVDEAGKPLRPAILYGIDTRAAPQIRALERRYGREALFKLGGNRLTSQSVGPKILWLREEEPDVYRRARWFLTASAYLVMRLCGEVAIDRHAASHYNPLIDIHRMAWSDRFADGIVDLDRLPAIHSSEDLVGTVGADAAREIGIPAGTPVTAGSIDTMAEAISVGVTNPGDLMVMYGSTAFLLLVLAGAARPHPDLWTTAGCFNGRYGISGGMATAGALTTWFRDQFAKDLVEAEAAEAAGGKRAEDPYEALADEAAGSTLGARGLVALPYFSGERTPLHDARARGVIAGLSVAHTRADVYRALLEATAYGIRHNLEVMRSTGAPIRRVAAVGGGAHNPLWLQIVSDVASIPQSIPERTTGASFGNAFLVGRSTGVIPSDAVLHDSWVRIAKTVEPDPTATEAYEPYYREFRRLYPSTKGTVHRLARLSDRDAEDEAKAD
jgi:xylulokinase